jgi:antitoxin component YwqK of YwqJK toxin-antitoxin module
MTSRIINNIRYFSVITFSLAFFSCGQQKEKERALLVTKIMPNGNIKVIGATINNKKEGLWITYDDSGRLSSQNTYIHDNLTGESISYWENGEVSSKGNIVNDQMEGDWTFFYGNNKIAQKGSYLNGNKIGIWEYYTERGNLDRKIEFFKGGEKKVVEDNHLSPPTPDQIPVKPVDSNNRAFILDSNGKEIKH